MQTGSFQIGDLYVTFLTSTNTCASICDHIDCTIVRTLHYFESCKFTLLSGNVRLFESNCISHFALVSNKLLTFHPYRRQNETLSWSSNCSKRSCMHLVANPRKIKI